MRWLVRGDIDGFFGLALDNLVQLILIDTLCRTVLGFSPELLYGRVLPGVAVSLLAGNLFYAWQARRLALREGRRDVCALPYGINTVSLFGYVFLVMLPAKMAAQLAGHPDPARIAWLAGLAATVGSGVIELSGSLLAERIRKLTPRAALLSTLAGIALTFISLGFLFRTYAHPLVGLATLAIVMMTYFGRVRFRGGIPGGLVAVAVGTLLAWTSGLAPVESAVPAIAHSSGSGWLHWPVPVLGDLLEALGGDALLTYLSIIIPMGLFNLVGSLQNIESAEAAGDSFATGPSLAVNGGGTLLAALFGSCFPTTLYIGHPGWKAMGARAGYSVLNGAFITLICVTGWMAHITWAVPVDAGMAIVLWIGMVITAQAFQAVPRAHAPAVVMGLLPGVAAWGALMAKNALRAAGQVADGAAGAVSGTGSESLFGVGIVPFFEASDTWIHGAFALEQGFIFASMILAAVVVFIIERQWLRGAAWCAAAALLACVGLMHSYVWTAGDTVIALGFTWPWENPWAAGYLAMGAVLVAAKWLTVPHENSD
ncbi:MAG: NCS2 family permease [Planctomycetota bacterium]